MFLKRKPTEILVADVLDFFITFKSTVGNFIPNLSHIQTDVPDRKSV